MKKFKNNALFLLYTIILGAIVGAIIWAFLRVMNLGIGFIWDFVPSKLGFPFYTVLVCTAGGLLTGLWKKKFGDTPEELGVVVAKVKKTNRYPYSNIFSSLVSAILPLLFGASIGPEAGLTGIIAGLCTWVGDRLKMYKKEVEELTQIGLSATLGTIFRSPMFGFFEPLEDERDAVIPKASKIVLYIAAILSSFGAFILLGRLLGGSGGIEGLEPGTPSWSNYIWAVPLTLAGITAGYIYYIFRRLTHLYESKLKKLTVTRAVIGGLLLGISGTFLPLTMFSGEHQISIIQESAVQIGAVMLLVIAGVKLLLTNVCISSGLKGGHFFPVIFCGICIGAAISLFTGVDMIFCMCVATTGLVGFTLKKPVATVLLLMIVFPPRYIPVMLFAAAAARFIPLPKQLKVE